MSTWISDSGFRGFRAGYLALILPLAGCLGEGTGEGGLSFRSPPGAANPDEVPVLHKIELFRGNVVVAGPRGYCIDSQSLRRGGDGGFVLIASCESLTGKAGQAVAPAVMTVSVLPRRLNAEQPTAADIAAQAAPAEVLAADDGDGISMVRLASGGDALMPGGDPKYWRGGMLINGHVVGLAVYGPKGSAIAGKSGRSTLLALAEILRERSPVKDYTPVAAETPADNSEKPKTLGALLGGLFPESD